MSLSKPDIAIIGAGIIGLSCAWELLRRGASVTLYEKQWPPSGASWAAAGMLAPAYELAGGNSGQCDMFELCCRGAKLWRGFSDDLERASGTGIGYYEGPTLAVALDAAQADNLRRVQDRLEASGMDCESLYRRDLVELERGVSPDFEMVLALPSDGRVNPRETVLALRIAIERAGGVFEWVPDGVRLAELEARFDACIDASGARRDGQIRPVKGVMLAFRRVDIPLDHVVRCGAEYAVPRGDKVLIGATVGEVPDARAYLLSRAVEFLPRVRKAALVDQWSGFRPAAPDYAPVMGRLGPRGHYIANGHYRNGVLLAPITAKIVADMVLEGEGPELADAFSPDRFGATA